MTTMSNNEIHKKGRITMKKLVLLALALILALSIAACAKSWVCDECGKSFTGKAYYGYYTTETFCEDCARKYWMPLDYRNYVKK